MYRGLILKNSNVQGYLDREVGIRPYKAEVISKTDGNLERNITVKITNEEQDLNLEEEFLPGTTQLYHNTVIFSPLEPKQKVGIETLGLPTYEFYDKFNYNSETYRQFAEGLREIDLPNFYLSQYNEENDKYSDLFAFENSIGSQDLFNDRFQLNNSYRNREESDTNILRNIFLARNAERYGPGEKDRFPYAVDIKLTFRDIDIMSTQLDNFKLHKPSIAIIDTIPKTNVDFQLTYKEINSERVVDESIPVASLEDLINYAYYPKSDTFVCLPDDLDRSRYIANLNKIRLNRKYNRTALNYLPNFFDIMDKSNVNNEILYVKIEKYSGNVPAGEPIQNIWLRDSSRPSEQNPEIETFGNYNYYDTQVKIGETYTYIIKAYVLIYGTEITCNSVNQQDKTAEFTMRPSYKIVEAILNRKTITVLPPLQLPPYVFPYYDSKLNKVSFYLQLERGRRFMDYITFTPQDAPFLEKIMSTTQYKKPEHAYIEEPSRFEVYRIEHMPLSLEDFSGNRIATVSRDNNSISANFGEYISYDKEYYYLFRALNTLGYPGNPSAVYKIKLHKGLTKNQMHVESFQIQKPERQYDGEKEFTKLLHIRPNLSDSFINTREAEDLDTYKENLNKITLGTDENFSVWGRRYKIRVRSKNTGRKIDINVNFKITRES